jgi:hypothetical protein
MIKTFHFPRHTLALGLILTTQLTAQKISIQFTATPPSTPSVSKAVLRYDKDFAYSFTLDDATIDAVTTVLPVMKGGVVRGNGAAFAGLFYTDGCGNSIPFKAGIAWNSANQFGVDVHTGNVSDQLSWGQLDTLYDEGWDVMNHSYSHKSRWLFPMTDTDLPFLSFLQTMMPTTLTLLQRGIKSSSTKAQIQSVMEVCVWMATQIYTP